MNHRKRTGRPAEHDLSTLPAPVTIAADRWQGFALAAAELIQVAGGVGSTGTTGVFSPPEKLATKNI
jgi:hypothetical protein